MSLLSIHRAVASGREAILALHAAVKRAGCAGVLTAVTLSGCAAATPAGVSAPSHTITVAGEGEASAQPDMATVRLGIEARGASAEQAVLSANRTMSDILQAVKAEGVAERDVQTADFSVYFERLHDRPDGPEQSEPKGPPRAPQGPAQEGASTEPPPPPPPIHQRGFFVVRNTVLVNVRELPQLGAVLGAAMQAGANDVQNLQMQLDKPTALRSQARQQAVKNAHEKALELAKASQVKLGPVVEITEMGSAQPPYPMAAGQMKLAHEDASVPTEPGQLSVREQVTVVFKIEE